MKWVRKEFPSSQGGQCPISHQKSSLEVESAFTEQVCKEKGIERKRSGGKFKLWENGGGSFSERAKKANHFLLSLMGLPWQFGSLS